MRGQHQQRRQRPPAGRQNQEQGAAHAAPQRKAPLNQCDGCSAHPSPVRHLVQMSAMRLGHALAGQGTPREGESHIEKHAGQQHRYQQYRERHALEPPGHHGQDRQHEATELTTDVAHEDAGTGKVERQEPGQAGRQQQAGEIGEPPARQRCNDRQHGAGDQGDAGGQAVQAVDEVHGVGGEQDPAQGQGNAGPAQRHCAQKRQVHAGDYQPAAHRKCRRPHLGGQLHAEWPIPDVVQERHQCYGGRSQDHAHEVAARQARKLGEQVQKREAGEEGGDDADSAAFRDRPLVRLARIGPVHDAHTDHGAHHAGRQQRQCCTER